MKRMFTAIIEYDPDTKQYIGIVPSIPGVHTVGKLDRGSEKKLERGA